MRSFGTVAGVTLLLTLAGIVQGDAAGRFDTKLAPDKQAVHVLNRLAYGPRPGEIEDVRRIGVDAWIRQQLNPAQLPENPLLAARLTPLASARLAAAMRFIDSTLCTGSRMVRPDPAIPRAMAWRIHHTAYVENLNPRLYWNMSTAFMRPRFPS